MTDFDRIDTILARRHWVFDLDGTLTLPVHDFEAIRVEVGVPAGNDILHFLASLPPADARPLHDRLQAIETRLAYETAAAIGASCFIERLSQRGDRLGVLTRNTRDNALRTLDLIGMADYFSVDCIIGRDEADPKPEPDGIHKLAALWDSAPAAMVMVGDYLYDLQAGHAAGTATVHIHGNSASRWPEWTDLCLPSFEPLAERLPQQM